MKFISVFFIFLLSLSVSAQNGNIDSMSFFDNSSHVIKTAFPIYAIVDDFNYNGVGNIKIKIFQRIVRNPWECLSKINDNGNEK